MLKQLPAPKNWSDFERLCCSLWKAILCDPDTQQNGRVGQAQSGVDVFGTDLQLQKGQKVGVQCKGKNGNIGSKVTAKELVSEVTKAKTFIPNLHRFVLATTAPRDSEIQEFARLMSDTNVQNGGFSISIMSWDDIEELIQTNPQVLQSYYPEALIRRELFSSADRINLNLSLDRKIEERIAELFNDPMLVSSISSSLIWDVRDLVIELADNAFRHGGAKALEVRLYSDYIEISDNGNPFNPLDDLKLSSTSIKQRGLKFIKDFTDKSEHIQDKFWIFDHVRNMNSVSLTFKRPLSLTLLNPCVADFTQDSFFGREASSLLAERFHFSPDCEVYAIVLDRRQFSVSGGFMFLDKLVSRLPPNKRLRVLLPDAGLRDVLQLTFDPKLVEIVSV
jgi:anti-sigma regulatory factor (Ser/Thr protein kinase)